MYTAIAPLLIITPAIGLFGLILLLLWAWALADVLSSRFRQPRRRWGWLAVVLLIPVLGMLVYYVWGGSSKKIESEYAAFLPDAYPEASSEHLKIVYRDSGMGLRNGLGQLILPPKYPEVQLLGDKLASFSPQPKGTPGRKFGLMHHAGEMLLPVEFDDIKQAGDSIFIRLGEEVQMFDLDGKFIREVTDMPG